MASREKKLVGNKQLSPRKEADVDTKSSDQLIDTGKEETLKILDIKKPRVSTPAIKLVRTKVTASSVGAQKDAKQTKNIVDEGLIPSKDGTGTPDSVTLVKKKRIRVRKLAENEDNVKLKQQRKKFVREDEDDTNVDTEELVVPYPGDPIVVVKSQDPPVITLTDGSSESESTRVSPGKSEKQSRKRSGSSVSAGSTVSSSISLSQSSTASVHHKPRLRRRLKPAGSDARNGSRLKIHARPYTTRSAGVLPQLLRNGKRRKFKEPNVFDGTVVPGTKRRRRLLSSTTDGSAVDSLNNSLVDGESKMKIGSESDSSYLDSSHLENGDWDSDADFKLASFESQKSSTPVHSGGENVDLTGDLTTGTPNETSENCKIVNSSPQVDSNNDLNAVFLETSEVKTPDSTRKTDSNSNLCQIKKVNDANSKPETTPTKSKTKTKETQSSLTKTKTSPEITNMIEQLPTIPLVDLHYLSNKQLEVASLAGEGSSNPPIDRSSTPDMKNNSENWETISVNSTPSSKNFDASLDDVSEKDFSTDCENVKDVRRSQRSSIRKTRAALLRLATSGKRSGKASEKADLDVLEDAEATEMVVDEKADEPVDVECLPEPTGNVSVKERLIDTIEVDTKPTVSTVEPPNIIPPIETLKIRAPPAKSEITCKHGTKITINSKSDTDLEILRNSDLRRKRVKSLSTQDIVSLVDRGLFPSKERRASELGRIASNLKPSGDITKFTLPDSKKMKLNSPRVKPIKFNIKLPDPIPVVSKLTSTTSCSTVETTPVPAMPSIEPSKTETCHETSEAVGDAAVPTSPDKAPASDTPPPLPAPQAAADEKIELVQDLNMEEEIKLLEAKLRKQQETLIKEAKETSESGPSVMSMNADIGNHDMAEKLREISMRFEDDSDIFPSLNIKKSSDSDVKDDTDLLEETPEQQAIKESIFQALGLQSLEAARLAKIANKHRVHQDPSYTGTLKTIIKLQRSPEKRTRPSKMKLYTDKGGKGNKEQKMNGIQYSICKDAGPSSEEPGCSTSNGVGNRKCLKPPITYRSYFDISSNPQLFEDQAQTEKVEDVDNEVEKDGEKVVVKQNLVIPEKASSFSIHPGRLCSDVCSYCFGKFGSLDTPCHIAQLKGSDRQVKILQAELHLTAESCLCDACYRHVDRKANCPSYREKHKIKTKRLHHMARQARPKGTCCVQACSLPAQHHVRRKWLTKLKRSIGKKVPAITSDKVPQHTPLPLCSQHFTWINHFMVCGLCRRRLNCNQMFLLGPEVHEINSNLTTDRIPVRLAEKLFLCKLCRYFTSLRIKFADKTKLTGSNKMFYESYRKKILQCLDMEVTEDPAPDEAPKPKKRRVKATTTKGDLAEPAATTSATPPADDVPVINLGSGRDSPPIIDMSNMVETQLTESMVDYSALQESPFARPAQTYRPTKIRLKVGNQSTAREERNGDARSFPDFTGTPELNVRAQFDFDRSVIVRSDSEGEWERCLMTLQYDKDSKVAFEKLKRPYGSQSSFFKHMLLLEQYWRSGELVPAPKSNPRTKSYLKSVRARINNFSKSITVPYQPVLVPSAPAVVTPTSAAPTASSSSQPVPIIDLPLRRRMSGGVMTTTTASAPSTSTSILSPGSSSNPLFVSHVPPKKFVMNPATGEMVATKRKPNIVQITKGGQPLFRLVDPTKSQLRALQGYKARVSAPSTAPSTATSDSECIPMICDVRSLSTEATSLWPINSAPPSTPTTIQGVQKLHISIVPKPSTSGPKPNTVVTPTGIVLSKKLDVSVVPLPRQEKPSHSSDSS